MMSIARRRSHRGSNGRSRYRRSRLDLDVVDVAAPVELTMMAALVDVGDARFQIAHVLFSSRVFLSCGLHIAFACDTPNISINKSEANQRN